MSSDLTALAPHARGREFTIPYAVGIELEVEFDTPAPPLPTSTNLQFKQDGSLTNGIEMVFRHPFPKTKLQDPADEMIAAIEAALQMTGGRVVLSPRAGTHFHVNVTGQTPLAAAKAYLLMCALEPKLFELFPTRKENIFCLPSFMADRPMMELAHALKAGVNILNWSNDMAHFRYSATNPAAIARFGSIELRMVPTMIDSKKMARWGLAFANLIQTGCELSSKDLCSSVADMSWLNRIVEDRSPIEMPNVDTQLVHDHLDKIRWCSEKLFLHERRLLDKKRQDKNRIHLGQQPTWDLASPAFAPIERNTDELMFQIVEEGRGIHRFGMDELRRVASHIDSYLADGPEGPDEEFFGRYNHRQLEETQNAIWLEIERREMAERPAPARPRFPNPPRPTFRAADWSTQAQWQNIQPVDPGGHGATPEQIANMTASDVERALEALRRADIEANPPVVVGNHEQHIVGDEMPDFGMFDDDSLTEEN